MSEFVPEDSFAKTLSQESCKNAWSKVGADPLTRKLFSGIKVAHEMVADEKEYPVDVMYCNIQQDNDM